MSDKKNQQLAIAPIVYDAVFIEETQTYALEELTAAQPIAITNDEVYAQYGEELRVAKAKAKTLAERKKAALFHVNALHDVISGIWREPEKQLSGFIDFLELRIKAYALAKERARQESLKLAAEAATSRDGEKLTKALQLSSASLPTKLEGVSVKPKWVGTIINEGLVTREYCVPDPKLIAAHCKRFAADEQPTPIPGVRFELDAAMRTQGAK
jgi:hypothetical protein